LAFVLLFEDWMLVVGTFVFKFVFMLVEIDDDGPVDPDPFEPVEPYLSLLYFVSSYVMFK
jgi:hypothetical protein